jgi:hypothetical protein
MPCLVDSGWQPPVAGDHVLLTAIRHLLLFYEEAQAIPKHHGGKTAGKIARGFTAGRANPSGQAEESSQAQEAIAGC